VAFGAPIFHASGLGFRFSYEESFQEWRIELVEVQPRDEEARH
jgi:hypothetical protein